MTRNAEAAAREAKIAELKRLITSGTYETLEKLEPNMELLKTLLTFRGHLQGEVLQTARRLLRQVVDPRRAQVQSRGHQSTGYV